MKNEQLGLEHGEKKQEDQHQPISTPLEKPSKGLRKWRQPKNVKDLASQANAVATMLLNGSIDLETARAYSAIARTIAQSVTAEMNKARFLKSQPDLEFQEDVYGE